MSKNKPSNKVNQSNKTQITFSADGYDFVISDYKVVSPRMRGLGDYKIVADQGKYYKNHGEDLLEVSDFEITRGAEKIDVSNFRFDTFLRVGVAIVVKGELLVLHRIKPDKEYYVYPGGHVKQGEEPLQALRREIKEESDIDLDTGDVKLVLDIQRPGFGPELFYLKLMPEKPNHFRSNPESVEGESIFEWHTLSEARLLPNLFPEELIRLIDKQNHLT